MNRNKAAAEAPPMDGQTAWTRADESTAPENGQPRGLIFPDTSQAPINPGAGFTSNAGGKRKGPRKPRSACRTAVYCERLIMAFPLEQRRAIHAMLASVCVGPWANPGADAMRDQIGPARQP